ncbi:hypothetical protein ABZ532_25420 [Streptomyces sp. NPDC019396]|uniref:hypothetical protein n=1 Tax=Streptomyces sp. NPDC019396 TaxID=3154687 RepID=UPI0033CD6238
MALACRPGRCGLVLTSLVLLGAVAVAVAATVPEAISGSTAQAASDAPAIGAVLRCAAVPALMGSAALAVLHRRRPSPHL